MADTPLKVSDFQIRSKPTVLEIVNPRTGEALQLPSPPKAAVREPASALSQSTIPQAALSKHGIKSRKVGSKQNTRPPEGTKAVVNLPETVTGKKAAKPAINGDPTYKPSQSQPQKAFPEKGPESLADRPQDLVDNDKLPPRVSDEAHWKPDVYAHEYVPEAFLAVNNSPAILLSSTPVQAVDYVRYVSSFASPLFLPPLSPLQAPTFNGELPVDSIDNLRIENYEQHLSDCLVLDLEAQVPEIRTYDMFGVQLGVIDWAQELYSLHVPGLRENTPRVAYGENIMVRQLVMDSATKLPLASPASGSTGYQISAVVVGVDRINETLNLRINGCTPHLLICNISFIVQARWIKSLQRAVDSMAIELKASKDHITESVDRSRDGSVSPLEHDFGPIGTPIKSPPARSRHDYFSSATVPPKSPSATRNEYFGAVGTPIRSPLQDRQDHLGSSASPAQGRLDYFRQHQARQHPQGVPHNNLPDIPFKYTNQAWLRRMLFPDPSDGVMQRSFPQGVFKRSWFDRHLNHEQKV